MCSLLLVPNVQSCDKQNLLMDLAKRSVLRSVNDTKCLSGESVLPHAVVLARCAAPGMSSWKRGVQVWQQKFAVNSFYCWL